MPPHIHAALTPQPLDPAEIVARVADPGCGAVLSFLGTVRDQHHGRAVLRLEYTAYEAMAVAELERIGHEVCARWPVRRIALVHRVGSLALGDVSIAIALALPHRREGFAALQYAIDTCKVRVPIWKREHFVDGAVEWVEGS